MPEIILNKIYDYLLKYKSSYIAFQRNKYGFNRILLVSDELNKIFNYFNEKRIDLKKNFLKQETSISKDVICLAVYDISIKMIQPTMLYIIRCDREFIDFDEIELNISTINYFNEIPGYDDWRKGDSIDI